MSAHAWEKVRVGRRRCIRCGAAEQRFRTEQLHPEDQSDEAGTTLWRAPDKSPDGWRTRAGGCYAPPAEGLTPIEAAIASGDRRRDWEEKPLARFGGGHG